METGTATPKLVNLGTSEFLRKIGASEASVVINPKTGKKFVSTSSGMTFKCQANIDQNKKMGWLMTEGDVDSACLINPIDVNIAFTITA